MKRDIPSEVKRILRSEVNYGCPVPSCGSPLLTWHHFDPPWHIKPHHNPEGMIALCTTHHPMADAGTFSVEQLRQFKQNPNALDTIKNKFEWYPEKCLIRLGGCYAYDWCRITIANIKVLEINKTTSGLTAISFLLEDENRKLLAEMDENLFVTYPENIHDIAISASSNRIKIWSDEGKIGFECHYSRKSPEEIERLIEADYPEMPEFVGKPEPIANLRQFYAELSRINEFPPNVAAIGMRRNDPNGTMIRWHASNHLGRDGKIPVINFVSCRFFSNGKCVELRNGKLGGLGFCGGNTFAF